MTEGDHVAAAREVPGVAGAAVTFRWTGSWLTVFAAVDPTGRQDPPPSLLADITRRLDSRRQTGYDLEVKAPRYVPLEIELVVCIRPESFRGDVLRAVAAALSNRVLADGRRGFFHPDNFQFEQPLYLSRLYAAVLAVEGVLAVHATTFKRLRRVSYGELAAGVLTAGPFEVIQLDNDPSFPDRGTLRLIPEGGK